MRRLIVTTCGTRLLSNTAEGALRRYITDYANAREPDEAGAHSEAIEAHIANCRQRVETANSIAEICKLSASHQTLWGPVAPRPGPSRSSGD